MRRLFQLIDKNIGLSQVVDVFRKNRKEKVKPLITISREFGSSGSIIAKNTAQKLGRRWRVYHEQIVDQIAKETQLDKKLIEEVDESKLPMIEEIIDDFFGRQHLSLRNYSKHLVSVLSIIGKQGYAIIVGRGGEYIFPDALNIRIIGEMNYRIKTIMRYRKVSEQKAKQMIEFADRKRNQFIKELFNHDPRKPHHYDLTLRTSDELSYEEITDIIVEAARKRFKL